MLHIIQIEQLRLKKNIVILLQFACISSVLLLCTDCKKQSTEENLTLSLIEQYKINIDEASGLSNYLQTNQFLTVSDNTNLVYVISNTGEILNILDFHGDDLEGVTFDSITSSILVVEERLKEMVRLDTNGTEIERYPLEIANTEPGHGPEGISIGPNNNQFFVVNEKLPGELLVMTLSGEITDQYELSFASDYSSIFYNSDDNSLWILSDDSKTVSQCDLTGKMLKSWNTGIKKAEGLVVDSKNSLMYIVSDGYSFLYIFRY